MSHFDFFKDTFIDYTLFHRHSEADTVFASLQNPVPTSTISLLMATIARRLTPQPIKLRADIELTCYMPAGIDAIKKALRAGEKESSEAVPIKAKLVAPPLYVLSTNATDKVCTPFASYCISVDALLFSMLLSIVSNGLLNPSRAQSKIKVVLL